MRILITGASGSRIATTDSSGIYEVDDLAPGDYTLQLLLPDTLAERWPARDGAPQRIHLRRQGCNAQRFNTVWNGRIEGRVTDASGKPDHVEVEVRDIRGFSIADHSQTTAPDGSYRFDRIPPGRCNVVAGNTSRTLDLARGQRITNIDLPE